ncbi:hypothetical protein [Calothrix sp. NIES-2100]|uniref:hypothetical protein n=1 Tax=Calothrix sp. NIES-2100 TaxID=1954172 RepID=UPI0030DC4089
MSHKDIREPQDTNLTIQISAKMPNLYVYRIVDNLLAIASPAKALFNAVLCLGLAQLTVLLKSGMKVCH